MRGLLIGTALAAAMVAVPARADPASDIAALEAQWSRAFLAGDSAALERIVAPEFTLVRIEAGEPDFTPRDRWFANARRLRFDRYETRVVGFTAAGDTAVATIEGMWTISRGNESRTERFVVTDTWVRRGGRWQAIFRHSSPMPPETPAPPAR
jgi:ketosteroid isomerase-like protein